MLRTFHFIILQTLWECNVTVECSLNILKHFESIQKMLGEQSTQTFKKHSMNDE